MASLVDKFQFGVESIHVQAHTNAGLYGDRQEVLGDWK